MVKGISPSQVGAMERSREIAQEIQRDFGREVLGDRRAGMTYEQISLKYGFDKLYAPLSMDGLNAALHYALRGYNNGEGSFAGLMEKGEAEKIRVDHIREYTYPVSLGNIPQDRRIKIASKAGKISYLNGAGIHGRPKEEAVMDSKKGGRNSVLSRGLTPWENGEILLAYLLDRSGAYDKKGICYVVNDLWENGRSVIALKNQLCRFRKSYLGIDRLLG